MSFDMMNLKTGKVDYAMTQPRFSELSKMVHDLIRGIGPCDCGADYKRRGRLDPDCTYHRVWGFDDDARLKALLAEFDGEL